MRRSVVLALALIALLLGAAPAWATSPVVAARNTSTEATATTTHSASLPASISAGDLLIVTSSFRGDPGTVTLPGGWTSRVAQDCASTACRLVVISKIAAGGEGASISYTTSNSVTSAHASQRITGHDPAVAVLAAATNPQNPPNLTTDGLYRNRLWITAAAQDTSAAITPPGGYSSTNQAIVSTGNNISASTGEMTLYAADEDPGAWAGINGNVASATLAVRPIEVFPLVRSRATSTANGTSHAITLPSGIAVGDLLVVAFAMNGTTDPTSLPSGWTTTNVNRACGGTLSCWAIVLYRVADGSEGSTISVTTAGSRKSAHSALRIDGTPSSGTVLTFSVTANTGSPPDPPNHTPGGGTINYLWLVAGTIGGDDVTLTGPTNYRPTTAITAGGTAGATIALAERHLAASAENPGAFAPSGGANWRAWSLAAWPASPTPTPSVTPTPTPAAVARRRVMDD